MQLECVIIRFNLMVLTFFPMLFASVQAVAFDQGMDRSMKHYDVWVLQDFNPKACEELCKTDNKCKSWTLARINRQNNASPQCFLSRFTEGRRDTCCVSGVIIRHEDLRPIIPPSGKGEYKQRVPKDKSMAKIPFPERQPTKEKNTLTPLRCGKFMALAVLQNRLAQELECGFEGELWRIDPDRQYDNCLESTEEEMQKQAELRKEMLDTCKKINMCQSYVQRALELSARAHEMRCDDIDLERAEWSTDRQRHMAFCRTLNNPENIKSILRNRESRLSRCRTSAQECKGFVAQAVNLSRAARNRHCGFRGNQWSVAKNVQARLCRNLRGKRARKRELAKRRALLRRCSEKQTPSITCTKYAQQAVVITKKARAIVNCPYKGPRWSIHKRKHRAWCKGKTVAQLKAEQAIRIREYQRCKQEYERRYDR